MSYLLDTNILSAHLRRPSGLQHRFVQHSGWLNVEDWILAESSGPREGTLPR